MQLFQRLQDYQFEKVREQPDKALTEDTRPLTEEDIARSAALFYLQISHACRHIRVKAILYVLREKYIMKGMIDATDAVKEYFFAVNSKIVANFYVHS